MDLTSKSHNLNNLLDESALLEICSNVYQIRDIYYDSSPVYWLTKIKHIQKYYRQAFFDMKIQSSDKNISLNPIYPQVVNQKKKTKRKFS